VIVVYDIRRHVEMEPTGFCGFMSGRLEVIFSDVVLARSRHARHTDAMTIRKFPDGFLWGAATAGHQNEGNNITSDTWFLENVTPSVFRTPSGAACNSWELWPADLDLVNGLGMNAYRFSVEWARVEPTDGNFDTAALDHYQAMLDRCLELGIAPIVTFNHFTAPHWFACKSAWYADDAAARFARYCDRVMTAFGDRIAMAVTLNEPNLPRLLSWLDLPQFIHDLERQTLVAASAATAVSRYRTSNVVIPEEFDEMQAALTAAHIAGKEAIKAHRPDLRVGFSIAIVDDCVVGNDASVRDRKRAEVYEHWLELASHDDFVGVQNYERLWYDGNGRVKPGESVPRNQMGSPTEPGSLAGAVRYAYERTGVPIMVTEHGMATGDDTQRAAFIEPALRELLSAIDEGVPVIGYTHWTLLDNFEWIFGYDSQLGLHTVDRTTFERAAKPSAGVLAQVISQNGVTES
jgi:beta-glucosidase